MGVIENALEGFFAKIGRVVGTYPWISILVSVVVAGVCGGGWAVIETESRPEKQWVAKGAIALEHNEYVKATWPANSRFNLYTATCADVDEGSCNILEPKYIKRFQEINARIMNVTVDGTALVRDIDEQHSRSESDPDSKRPWVDLAGDWSYLGKAKQVNNSVVFEGRNCFSFGPFCAKASILDVFREDDNVIRHLDSDQIKRALNFWEQQETMCPVSIASADSPCFDTACQKYWPSLECRRIATDYCSSVCPTRTFTQNGREWTEAVNLDTCMDMGCIQLGSFGGDSTNDQDDDMLDTDLNSTVEEGGGEAPASAFQFEPSKVSTMVGAIGVDTSGHYVSGKHLSGYYAITKKEYFCPSQGNVDPLSDEWERRVLCIMGINADESAEPKLDCPKDELLVFNGFFGRSFADEFGAAIRGDVAKLGVSYILIIVYCAFMIGKRDVIHCGLGMSITAVVVIGMVIVSAFGFMGYCGVPNGNLNNNLYFLVLGLGVDDAFVLTSEFVRHTVQSPETPIPERIAKTAQTGGVSVLITSVTDALAFLIGSSTVLPALSWFCAYAGTAIALCYIFQLTVFLPALAINAKRVEANRRDLLCCVKAAPRDVNDPQGCCCCTPERCVDNMLGIGLKRFIEKATTLPGQVLTILLFLSISIVGIVGSTQVYKDFKLEWFIPDDSYVNKFFDTNSKHFASGTKISINLREEPDAFEVQWNLRELYGFLSTSELVNQDVEIDSWYQEFMEWALSPTEAATASASFSPDRTDAKAVFTDRSAFYTALHLWYRSGPGSRHRGSLRWNDVDCEVESNTNRLPAGCDVEQGLKASRFNAELTLASTNRGTDRYNTMTSLRADVDRIYPGGFPFSFDFLYWEEVGVIDEELVRNLLVCGAVITAVVMLLVPNLRISVWVIVCVCLSIVDTLGFMYYWDVTVSGVSTIYILICVGLAVDYAAHIAHMFKESIGDARDRAITAVERIGPCTFNAVMSSFLAVVVIGFSNSYVFRIFFKVLFLVVIIAGAHGLWLLPVILSLLGGSKSPGLTEVSVADVKGVDSDTEAGQKRTAHGG